MKLFPLLLIIVMLSPNRVNCQSPKSDTATLSPLIIFCRDNQVPVEQPIHLDWVQFDKEIIQKKLNRLPEIGSTIDKIETLLPNFLDGKCNCSTVTWDLGYGLKSTTHTIYGGYGSYTVDALYFNNLVIKFRMRIGTYQEILEKYLLPIIKLPFFCLNGNIVYETTYQDNLEKYNLNSGFVFIESRDTNYFRRQAINYFTDIFTGGTFEKPYYILFGLGAETFNNLRYFIVNKDYEALHEILYCPSPTSRLFAARTLIYMKEKFGYTPNLVTEHRIKVILKDAQPVASGIVSCFMNKFTYDYFDVVNNFELYLKTQ